MANLYIAVKAIRFDTGSLSVQVDLMDSDGHMDTQWIGLSRHRLDTPLQLNASLASAAESYMQQQFGNVVGALESRVLSGALAIS